MNRSNLIHTALAALLLMGISTLTNALPSDREQVITIQSDRALRDEKKGVTIYSGSVQMDQGSMRILADEVVIHSDNEGASKIIATGQPAHYQQQPSADKQLVIAKGDRIEYLVTQERLYLIDNASLKQDGSTITGKRINYDIKEAVVKAEGSTTSSNERIHMVIPPKSQRQ